MSNVMQPGSAHFRLKLGPPTGIDPPEKCEADVKTYLPTWHVVTPDYRPTY